MMRRYAVLTGLGLAIACLDVADAKRDCRFDVAACPNLKPGQRCRPRTVKTCWDIPDQPRPEPQRAYSSGGGGGGSSSSKVVDAAPVVVGGAVIYGVGKSYSDKRRIQETAGELADRTAAANDSAADAFGDDPPARENRPPAARVSAPPPPVDSELDDLLARAQRARKHAEATRDAVSARLD